MLDSEFQGSKLVSAMTKQQYLDALSAPRVDPTKQGKKVMMSRPHSDDDSSDEVKEGEENIVQDDARNKVKSKRSEREHALISKKDDGADNVLNSQHGG